ncbi:Uncharacterised protein [Vibrio cholerae]|uniref:Uncharacterized protein n=1 Tax=Vibrio cholerae TaxID=666 RepID=A0A655QHD2_VIBCL|nr:Uncharacterised protein [Vibrio cholerae]CSA13884.1 Uncharacterised protein [Vibrio cholerae]CSA48619.1 Uncharacterised protein [Vibrio cholerae]CSB30034.1 Uncharacterised protein [Vibrio cholerae]CSB52937.1 Uncharacterised protein [Vibrio cholerae]
MVVQGFHTKLIRCQQILEQFFHRYFARIEIAWIVVSIGRDRLVNELLHDTH